MTWLRSVLAVFRGAPRPTVELRLARVRHRRRWSQADRRIEAGMKAADRIIRASYIGPERRQVPR